MKRWVRQHPDGQRYVAEPEGTTAAPAVSALPRDWFPGGAERAELIQNIDWSYVRRVLDAGLCVAIAVDLADAEPARQCAEMQISLDLVSRVTPDGTLFLLRPGVPGAGGL